MTTVSDCLMNIATMTTDQPSAMSDRILQRMSEEPEDMENLEYALGIDREEQRARAN